MGWDNDLVDEMPAICKWGLEYPYKNLLVIQFGGGEGRQIHWVHGTACLIYFASSKPVRDYDLEKQQGL